MTNAELRRRLRPLLGDVLERTGRDRTILLHLAAHFAVVCGLAVLVALHVGSWPWYLVLGLALIAGNSVTVLGYAAHEIGHGAGGFRHRWTRRLATWFGWAFSFWATPTSIRHAHNKLHHRKTNQLEDPDRRLNIEELEKFSSIAKVACWIFPNSRHPLLTGLIGFSASVFSYHSHILFHSVFATGELYDCGLTAKERRRAALEFLGNAGLYLGLWALSGFSWLMLGYFVLAYFVGTSVAGAYVATNHLMCGRSPEPSSALANTVSLRMPRWLDAVHLNFSHHVEHHLFPSASYRALPAIRKALKQAFPEEYKELGPSTAVRMLLGLPMGFQDDTTLVHYDRSGPKQVPYPIAAETPDPQVLAA